MSHEKQTMESMGVWETEANPLLFAASARTVGEAARAMGLRVPAFRSPPRLVGADRSIRRHADGGATIAVRLRGRPDVAVTADMIDGVVVSNRLVSPDADRCRGALWAAVGGEQQAAA